MMLGARSESLTAAGGAFAPLGSIVDSLVIVLGVLISQGAAAV